MTAAPTALVAADPRVRSLPFYYGWVMVVVAALTMVATLPGRTHGLGMVTERLLADTRLGIDRVQFSDINLWATLLGAAFCLPCGRLLDRYGVRAVLMVVVVALAGVVLAMTQLTGWLWLFVAITLTRGFGQSALSVVSIAMVGKWFTRRSGVAMAAYSILLSLGFIGASLAAKPYATADWRVVWSSMGFALIFGLVPLGWLLTKNSPESCGLVVDGDTNAVGGNADGSPNGMTLNEAIRSPAFWIFGLASSTYGLISSGLSLFNESILKERGFEASVFYDVLALTTGIALATTLFAGWLARRAWIGRLMAGSMAVLAASLCWLPHVVRYDEVVLYATGLGISGGIVTVVFFSVWGQLFGRAHVGRIQGAAQMLTVLASAVGPKMLAECQARTGSYAAMFYALAGTCVLLSVAAWFVSLPNPEGSRKGAGDVTRSVSEGERSK